MSSTTSKGRSKSESVFAQGEYSVVLIPVEEESKGTCRPPPPKSLIVAAPTDVDGCFPVLVLLHGYLLYNTFYSELLRHIASHGFVVVAPQLYVVAGSDATTDINHAAATIDWIPKGLQNVLPDGVLVDASKLALSGHSRGGKAAFGVALGMGDTSVETMCSISALIGIDPEDGSDENKHTPSQVLTGEANSFDLNNMPVLVLGCGLSELKKSLLFPPCAPRGVNHRDFFAECQTPAWYLVARDYGHLDMLDDDTKGLRGILSYCLCKSGGERQPMRRFVGGLLLAFMRSSLLGDSTDLDSIINDPGSSPVVLSENQFK